MPNAKELADALHDRFTQLLEDGSVDRNAMRLIIVGPNPHFDALMMWVKEEWGDHPYVNHRDALAGVPLGTWLDELDALEHEVPVTESVTQSEPHHRSHSKLYRLDKPEYDARVAEKVAQLRTTVQEALRLLAVREPVASLPRLTGLSEVGMTSSDTAHLVAFGHPHGGLPLWPVRDKRPKYNSCYHWAALTDEGLVSFFPQGEDDVYDEEAMDPKAALFRFDDMIMTRAAGSGIGFRLKGELEDREYQAGHTHSEEEYGGPDRDAVNAALLTHFQKRPDLFFDPLTHPRVDDRAAVERWTELYESTGQTNGAAIVQGLAKEQSLEAARAFVDSREPTSEDYSETLTAWASILVEQGRHEECLGVAEQLSGESRGRAGRHELGAMMALGRWAEIPARYDFIVEQSPGDANYLAPWKAIALSHNGETAAAIELVEPLSQKDAKKRWREDCLYALAHAQYADSIQQAVSSLRLSLHYGCPYLEVHADAHFSSMPELAEVMSERKRLLMDRKSIGEQLTTMHKRVTPKALAAAAQEAEDPNAWVLQSAQSVEETRHLKQLVTIDDYIYVPDQTNGLRVFHKDRLADGLLNTLAVDEGSFEAATTDGRYIYLANYRYGLEIADAADRENPTIVFKSPTWDEEQYSDVQVSEGICVVGHWRLDLYDVADPTTPKLLTSIGAGDPAMDSSFYADFRLVGKTLYLASNKYGLLVVDLSEPSKPKLRAALGHTEHFRPKRMAVVRTSVFVGADENTWLIDVADPDAPRSLGTLPFRWHATPLVDGDTVTFVAEKGRVWTVDLSDPTAPCVRNIVHRLKSDEVDPDDDFDIRDARDVIRLGDELLILEGSAFQRFARGPDPRPQFEECVAAVRKLTQPIVKWCRGELEQLSTSRPDFRAGVLMLEWWDDEVTMGIDIPRSLFGVENGPVGGDDFLERAISLEKLVDGWSEPDYEDYDERRDDLLGEAQHEVLLEVLSKLAESSETQAVAAGRLYLATRGSRGMVVANCLLDADKPWTPWRSKLKEKAPPTAEEMLAQCDAWKHREKLEKLARQEDGDRETVFRLAAEGNSEAQVVALRIADEYLDETMSALLAGANKGELDHRAYSFLAKYRDAPGAEAALSQAFEHGDDNARFEAAKALERMDDDSMLELVRKLLRAKDDYASADLAAEMMQEMDARLPELLDDIRGWIDRASNGDDRIPTIAPHLFRAGHRELPAKLKSLAASEKSDEQYHSEDSMFGDWDQSEACKAERMWTGWLLAERVRKLKAAGETRATVWPEGIVPEPYPASWNYVLDSAKPYLEDDESWDWLVDRVAEHLEPSEDYVAERALAKLLYGQAVEKQISEVALKLGEAILRSPEGTFDDKERRSVERRLTYARLTRGWEHVKARELDQAAQIATAILTIEPNNGQALFFDARLTWLTESTEAAMQKVDKYVKQIAANDGPGRGRLLNLYGCALDELGRQAEAIPWFEKAAKAHPDDAQVYLANVAECHHKLGDEQASVHWAQQAKAKGADTAIIEEILGES